MNYKSIILNLILVIVLYIGLLRPVRVLVQQHFLVPIATRISTVPSLSLIPQSTPGLYVYWNRTTERKLEEQGKRAANRIERKNVDLFSFNGFGDKFFLIGAIYFLAVGLGWKPVLHLFLLHQAITLLSLISLLLAVSTHPAWLYPMNFLVTYITPAATGMFVLTVGRRR